MVKRGLKSTSRLVVAAELAGISCRRTEPSTLLMLTQYETWRLNNWNHVIQMHFSGTEFKLRGMSCM